MPAQVAAGGLAGQAFGHLAMPRQAFARHSRSLEARASSASAADGPEQKDLVEKCVIVCPGGMEQEGGNMVGLRCMSCGICV